MFSKVKVSPEGVVTDYLGDQPGKASVHICREAGRATPISDGEADIGSFFVFGFPWK